MQGSGGSLDVRPFQGICSPMCQRSNSSRNRAGPFSASSCNASLPPPRLGGEELLFVAEVVGHDLIDVDFARHQKDRGATVAADAYQRCSEEVPIIT